MLKARKYGQTDITLMLTDLKDYKNGTAPFDAPFHEGDTVEVWWKRIAAGQPVGRSRTIVILARMLACIVPHAADPERAFSFMGNVHTHQRNRFKVSTVGKMAEIKSYLQLCPPENM